MLYSCSISCQWFALQFENPGHPRTSAKISKTGICDKRPRTLNNFYNKFLIIDKHETNHFVYSPLLKMANLLFLLLDLYMSDFVNSFDISRETTKIAKTWKN